MEDVFDAAWQNRSTARNTTVEAELASLIDVYGLALLEESGQIRHSLAQAFPGERRNIAAILGALSAGIPERLRTADEQNQLPAILKECAQDLQEQGGLDAELATWAVRAWAYALALPSQGLGGAPAAAAKGRAVEPPTSRPQAPTAPSGPKAAAAPHFLSTAATVAEATIPFGRMHTTTSPPANRNLREAPPREAAPVLPVPPVPQVKAAPPQVSAPVAAAPVRLAPVAAPPVPVAAPTPPEPAAASTPPTADPAPASSDDFPPTLLIDHGEPTILVEPLFSDGDIERIARGTQVAQKPVGNPTLRAEPTIAAPIAPAVPDAPIVSEPVVGAHPSMAGRSEPLVAPAWERPVYERPGAFGRPAIVGMLLIAAALVAGFFGLRWMNERTTTLARDAPTANVATATPGDATPAPARQASTIDPSSVGTAGRITSQDPSPAGRAELPAAPPRADTMTSSRSAAPFSAPSSDPSSGSAAPSSAASSAPSSVASQVPTAPSPQAPATQESTAASEAPPASSSAPEAAPSTPRERATPATRGVRPSIARIDVPRVVEGDPFNVVLSLNDARDVVSIERRIIESAGVWPRNGTIPVVGGQRRANSNVVTVPFHAMDAPAHATIAFTAIARDGSRSEPKIATITVGGAMSTGAPTSASTACTPATCGTVSESREIVPDVGDSAIYRTTVRMGDGETLTFTAPYRLQVGMRLQLVGDRFVTPGSGSR